MANIREVVTKKAVKYQVTVRVKGYKPEYKTFKKKTQAKEWANEVELQMKKGVWNKVNIERVISPINTVGELIDDFEKNITPKKYANPKQYTVMYNWWKEKIGHINLSELNAVTLTQCKNILMNEAPDKPYKGHIVKSNSTVRKYMFALSAILKYADRELEIINRNPMSKIEKPKKIKGVVRFLSDSEQVELLSACKKHSSMLYTFVVLAIYSGGRYSELLNLKIENIDFENNILHFLQTKNGENRGVPIYYKITEILKKYIDEKNIKSGYIFIGKRKDKPAYLKGCFLSAIKNTNIKNFKFHDLRHTYASYLAQNGAELLEIAELMGHKNLNQVQIYAHLTKKHTSKLVRKMTANMFVENF